MWVLKYPVEHIVVVMIFSLPKNSAIVGPFFHYWKLNEIWGIAWVEKVDKVMGREKFSGKLPIAISGKVNNCHFWKIAISGKVNNSGKTFPFLKGFNLMMLQEQIFFLHNLKLNRISTFNQDAFWCMWKWSIHVTEFTKDSVCAIPTISYPVVMIWPNYGCKKPTKFECYVRCKQTVCLVDFSECVTNSDSLAVSDDVFTGMRWSCYFVVAHVVSRSEDEWTTCAQNHN